MRSAEPVQIAILIGADQTDTFVESDSSIHRGLQHRDDS